MSLNVPESLVVEVSQGKTLELPAFIKVIHDSLHKAFHIVGDLVERLRVEECDFAAHMAVEMDDATRGELLRMMSSNAIRGAVERHFGVVLAFQNCHKVAVFLPEAVDGVAWKRFTSIEAQILNQSPLFRDC